MKKLIFLFIILGMAILAYSQVNFSPVSSIIKVNPSDELEDLQIFKNNGVDEILAIFSNQDYYRTVRYSPNGDTLRTFIQQRNGPWWEYYEKGYAFYGQNNEKILLLVQENDDFSSSLKFILYDYNTFTPIDSIAVNISDYVNNDYGIADVITSNINNDTILYAGIYASIPERDEIIYNTLTFKVKYSNGQLEFLEEISDVGSYFIKYPDSDFIIAIGEMEHVVSYNEFIEQYKRYDLALISNDYVSSVQTVLSVDGNYSDDGISYYYDNYPTNFMIISLNDTNIQNYGMIVYYKIHDSDSNCRHFKCFNSDFSDLSWEQTNSNLSDYYDINTSTCVSANNQNHYVMYYNGYQLEIRNRITGNIVHNQTGPISPSKILRKSNGELLFFVTRSDMSGYDIYTLDGEIQVTAQENQLPVENIKIFNYPNPFNPSTTIAFELPNKSNVQIEIFNIKGQKIKALTNRVYQAGEHKIVWNGQDNKGKKVSSGIYFYKIKTENFEKENKMIVIK